MGGEGEGDRALYRQGVRCGRLTSESVSPSGLTTYPPAKRTYSPAVVPESWARATERLAGIGTGATGRAAPATPSPTSDTRTTIEGKRHIQVPMLTPEYP